MGERAKNVRDMGDRDKGYGRKGQKIGDMGDKILKGIWDTAL